MNEFQIQYTKAVLQLMIINVELAVEVAAAMADAALQQQRDVLEAQEHLWERL